MDRRTLMKSAASGAVGACLLGGMTDNAMNARAAASPAKPHSGDFVETADGVKLAYTDWGSGKPVVFIHAWALPSPRCELRRLDRPDMPVRVDVRDLGGDENKPCGNGLADRDAGSERQSAIADGPAR